MKNKSSVSVKSTLLMVVVLILPFLCIISCHKNDLVDKKNIPNGDEIFLSETVP
jgi:hypothetical protein